MEKLDEQEMQSSLLLSVEEGVRSAGRAEEPPCLGMERLGGQESMLSFHREAPWEGLEGPAPPSVVVGSQSEGLGHV